MFGLSFYNDNNLAKRLREITELITGIRCNKRFSSQNFISPGLFLLIQKLKSMKKPIFGITAVIILFYGFSHSGLFKSTDCEKILQTQNNNKKLVAEFYQKLFGDKNLDAIDEYIVDDYIQHNPMAADGKQALKDVLKKWFVNAPKEKIDIQHLGADGDFVYIHLRSKMGTKTVSVIDIFRLKDNKIVEHWDVIQEVPEKSANNHPMF